MLKQLRCAKNCARDLTPRSRAHCCRRGARTALLRKELAADLIAWGPPRGVSRCCARARPLRAFCETARGTLSSASRIPGAARGRASDTSLMVLASWPHLVRVRRWLAICQMESASRLVSGSSRNTTPGDLRPSGKRLARQAGSEVCVQPVVSLHPLAQAERKDLLRAGPGAAHGPRALLENSSLSVASIASLVGYSGTTNFYKKFSEHYGMTPSELRAARERA